MSTLVLVVVAALWGAAAGTLLPRPAHRFSVAQEEDWRERCPGGHPIGGWLGWARCRDCTDSPSYGPGTALMATVTALVCAALAAATGTRPELGVWLLLAPVGVLLTVVDLRVRRLPDALTLPLAGAALLLLGWPPSSPNTPATGPPPCGPPSRSAPATSYYGSSTPAAWASAM